MKNIYHLAIEFYNLDDIDPNLKVGKMITFIDSLAVLRIGKIIECHQPSGAPDGYYHDFTVECQSLITDGKIITRNVVIDRIVKEGQEPQRTITKLTTPEKLEFPLRT